STFRIDSNKVPGWFRTGSRSVTTRATNLPMVMHRFCIILLLGVLSCSAFCSKVLSGHRLTSGRSSVFLHGSAARQGAIWLWDTSSRTGALKMRRVVIERYSVLIG